MSYGLKVISSDGTTVIIDGTSAMFRILATGTLSNTQDASQGDSAVTLTGLGTFATTPAHMAENGATTAATAKRFGTLLLEGALSSPIPFYYQSETRVELDGSSYAVVTLFLRAGPAGSVTRYTRYYVLAQTAI